MKTRLALARTRGCVVVAALFLTLAPVTAASDADARDSTEVDDAAPRVAVAEFEDTSGARWANVGAGVADKLGDRLAAGGARVVDRGELEALLQSQDLDPTSQSDLCLAARWLGVDLVVTGTVVQVDLDASTLDLGPLHVAKESAHAAARARLVDSAVNQLAAEVSASGSGSGETDVSVSLGDLFSLSPPLDVCGGGLRPESEICSQGELVALGYADPPASGWFGLEIYSHDGAFLRWLGWRFVPRGECKIWFWDQRDALGERVGPGFYSARLRDGDREVGAVTFQIQPSLVFALPSLESLTVGTEAFDRDALGAAIDDMVSQLASSLLPSIFEQREREDAAAESVEGAPAPALLGQVAAVLPDGRIAISVGTADGVAVEDRFEVLAVDHLVFDPDTLSIAAYDVVALKGVVRVVEVRELASYAVCEGDVAPLVGDLVRLLP